MIGVGETWMVIPGVYFREQGDPYSFYLGVLPTSNLKVGVDYVHPGIVSQIKINGGDIKTLGDCGERIHFAFLRCHSMAWSCEMMVVS